MLTVAILAGGLATRLEPILKDTPKSLIEICGKPFIDWQLKLLAQSGIDRVVLCTSYKSEMIEKYVGDGTKYGIQINYSKDGQNQLGTGGAIKKATQQLEESFMVLYGDSYLPFDYQSAINTFFSSKKRALMSIYKNKNLWDKSNVQYDGFKILEYNKVNPNLNMEFIDYGMGVISSSCFDEFVSGAFFDLADLYHKLSIEDELAAYVVENRFYEIGTVAGIKEFERYIKEITQ